jgi:glutamate--glyoxylate aminotransferase
MLVCLSGAKERAPIAEHACRKVAMDLGEPYASQLELVSFHTVSKGVYGECGLRGGYMEMVNIHPGTVSELYKVASINLCPNTVGQLAVGLMAKEPAPGSESYEPLKKEKEELAESLRRKAHMMTDFFNSLQGVTCTFTEGAMYSFPSITCAPLETL